jgi:hypothetical protein
MMSHLSTWEHYKGGRFTLLYLAENSNQRDEVIAVYVSHTKHKVLARPWLEWHERVMWPDGVERTRYVPVDPEL